MSRHNDNTARADLDLSAHTFALQHFQPFTLIFDSNLCVGHLHLRIQHSIHNNARKTTN